MHRDRASPAAADTADGARDALRRAKQVHHITDRVTDKAKLFVCPIACAVAARCRLAAPLEGVGVGGAIAGP